MKAPPLLPEETLARVLRVARLDGSSVLVIAGVFALISALAGDKIGAVVGLLVAGAGAVELHGATLLDHGEPRGLRWLVSSQLVLLFTVLGYCAVQLVRARLPEIPPDVDALLQESADQLGMTKDAYALLVFNRILYIAVAAVTLIYQGGMTLYYFRRRGPITRALDIAE